MQHFISPTDFLLAPLYIALLYFLIKKRSIKYKGTGLYKFYLGSFILHMAGAMLYAIVIQFYYGGGDSFGFFMGSNFITDITKEELTLNYFFSSPEQLSKLYLASQTGNDVVGIAMSNSANLMVMKISAALSFICFNRYLLITLFFGFFSFAGLWRLFITFNELLGNKVQRILAITVLYTPSIWFWGSGLIKDSICIGCLGFIINTLHKNFKKKIFLPDTILLIAFFYTLFIVKSYIAGALIIALIIFILHFYIKSRKTKIEKWIYTIAILLIGIIFINFVLESYINTLLEDTKTAIDTFKNAYDNLEAAGDSGSGFSGKNIDFTTTGILLRIPSTIFTTLYRPFLWEIRNLMMLLSSLESLLAFVALSYTLYKTRTKFLFYIFSSPFILYAFIIILILGVIIGLSTFNFGTMVRYRIPILPFYSFMLISIYIKDKENRKSGSNKIENESIYLFNSNTTTE